MRTSFAAMSYLNERLGLRISSPTTMMMVVIIIKMSDFMRGLYLGQLTSSEESKGFYINTTT